MHKIDQRFEMFTKLDKITALCEKSVSKVENREFKTHLFYLVYLFYLLVLPVLLAPKSRVNWFSTWNATSSPIPTLRLNNLYIAYTHKFNLFFFVQGRI